MVWHYDWSSIYVLRSNQRRTSSIRYYAERHRILVRTFIVKLEQMLSLRYRCIIRNWLGECTNRGLVEHRRAIFAGNMGGRTFACRDRIDFFCINQLFYLGRVTFGGLLLQKMPIKCRRTNI